MCFFRVRERKFNEKCLEMRKNPGIVVLSKIKTKQEQYTLSFIILTGHFRRMDIIKLFEGSFGRTVTGKHIYTFRLTVCTTTYKREVLRFFTII